MVLELRITPPYLRLFGLRGGVLGTLPSAPPTIQQKRSRGSKQFLGYRLGSLAAFVMGVWLFIIGGETLAPLLRWEKSLGIPQGEITAPFLFHLSEAALVVAQEQVKVT